MNVIIADIGNQLIKVGNLERHLCYPHKLIELSDTKWSQLADRQIDHHEHVARINGVPFAFAGLAERHGNVKHITGAKRYTPEYYGVFIAYSLARLFERSHNEIFLYGSHAPRDLPYRKRLMQAAFGEWEVEYCGKTLYFNVVDANTFDEPLGGLMNLVLADSGTRYQNRSIVEDGISLVIDIGGLTTDTLVVEKGGTVDYLTARSEDLGILGAIDDFESMLWSHYPDILQDVIREPEIIREAIRTGKYNLRGKGTLPCHEEADQACFTIVNKVKNIFQERGGLAAFDNVILTGGGSALLEYRLRVVLGHPNTFLAGPAEELHLTNLFGGRKLYRFYQNNS